MKISKWTKWKKHKKLKWIKWVKNNPKRHHVDSSLKKRMPSHYLCDFPAILYKSTSLQLQPLITLATGVVKLEAFDVAWRASAALVVLSSKPFVGVSHVKRLICDTPFETLEFPFKFLFFIETEFLCVKWVGKLLFLRLWLKLVVLLLKCLL